MGLEACAAYGVQEGSEPRLLCARVRRGEREVEERAWSGLGLGLGLGLGFGLGLGLGLGFGLFSRPLRLFLRRDGVGTGRVLAAFPVPRN